MTDVSVGLSADEIGMRVDSDLAKIALSDLVELIRSLRVLARCERRPWNYGAEGQAWPCWIFAEHPESNTAFAYCEHGFGPGYPWGSLSISGKSMSMGMDDGWFLSIEDLFRNSLAWSGENPPGYEVG